jgi:superfamily II DNA or RNA helicase
MSSSEINISSFIGSYPTIDDEDLSYQLARKKEFYDVKLESSEEVPESAGELLKHQQAIQRLMSSHTQFKELLLVHGLGSGKTCTSSAVEENLKSVDVNGKPRRPALVITKSDDIARNYTQEIANVCTKNVYMPRPTQAEIRKGVEMTEEAKVQRLNREVEKSYEIVTFERFLKKLPNDTMIKKNYSNRLIIIDEAHMLRIQPRHKKKKTIDEEAEPKEEEDIKDSLYIRMHHFLHTVEGCRVLLLTGTPITDKTSEIASLINLINPLDKQLPTGSAFNAEYFDDKGNLLDDKIDELKEYFKGKVSYLRQMVTTAERLEQGVKQPWLRYVTVYPDGMSEFQSSYAMKAKDTIETKVIKVKGKLVEREIKGGTILKLARDAMNMVIPIFDKQGNVISAEYGPEAFQNAAVKKIKRRGKTEGSYTMVDTYLIDNQFLVKEIRDNLGEYSTKFASIIDEIKRNPKEIVFIYNEHVTGPGGSIMLALCLQIHGFSWIKTDGDIVRPSEKKRFAVITSDPQTTSQGKQIQDLLKSANKADNKYGDRLQIIIGSEKIALGLSIKNVRQIHILMPHWNISTIDQARNRGFRFGGHSALPREERKIRIYNHVAVERAESDSEADVPAGVGYPKDVGFTATETTDIYIYKIAEEKEHKDTQIYRILKEVSVDCAITYNRNVLVTDVAGTRECDYRECNYQCDGFPLTAEDKKSKEWDYSVPESELDYSTYNLFYSSGRVKDMMDDIIALFNNYFVLKIDVVKDLLSIPDDEMFVLLSAIDNIINGRVLIRNRYGFGSYLKEHGNIIFLDTSISATANYPESTYIQNPLITERSSMDSIIEIMELDNDKPLVLKFCKNPTIELLDKLAYKTKIILLEIAFATHILNKPMVAPCQMLLDDLGDDIYQMKDGTNVHILYTDEYKGVAYDVSAKDIRVTGMMRYFDIESGANTTTGVWRYVEDIEKEKKYVEEVRSILSAQKSIEDNEYGISGWVSKRDNSFRIEVKNRPNAKGVTRGMVCTSYDIPVMVDIFINNMKHLPDGSEYKSVDKEELIKLIKGVSGFSDLKEGLDKRDTKYLRGLMKLLSMKKDELCKEAYAWFEEKGLLTRRR